jgi:hypothetical protein
MIYMIDSRYSLLLSPMSFRRNLVESWQAQSFIPITNSLKNILILNEPRSMKIIIFGASLVIGLFLFKFAASMFLKIANSILDESIKKAEKKLKDQEQQATKK